MDREASTPHYPQSKFPSKHDSNAHEAHQAAADGKVKEPPPIPPIKGQEREAVLVAPDDKSVKPDKDAKGVAGRKKFKGGEHWDVASGKQAPVGGHKLSEEEAEKDEEGKKEEKHETEEEHEVEQELNGILKKGPTKDILLEKYSITPTPYVVELDEHRLGPGLQAALEKSTGRRTVPNVLINGKSIGGGDDVQKLDLDGELVGKVKGMGGKRITEARVPALSTRQPGPATIMAKSGRKSKETPGGNGNGDQNLGLNPQAISLLTKKIEANLKNGQHPKVAVKTHARSSKTDKTGAQKSTPSTAYRPLGVTTLHTNKNNGTQRADTRGKKRLRDGQLKDLNHEKPHVNGTEKTQKSRGKHTVEQSSLENEILALGGSKDDLKLIEGVASESEFESVTPRTKDPKPKGLEKELLRFVEELGIEEVSPALDEDSVSESDDDGFIEQDTLSKLPEAVNGKNSKDSKTARRGTVVSQLQVEPHPEWYTAALPALTAPDSRAVALPPDLITRIHDHAKSLLEGENERYASRTGSATSDRQFYSTIMSTGTLSDKISALTLSIQESPLHNVKTLETLVGLARKRSRGQAVEVLGALKDLFGLGSVLPPGRKLRALASQPDLLAVFSSNMKWASSDTLPKPLTKTHLILWAFEDWLKNIYFEILKILETWCNDEVVFARAKAVDYVCQLLREKPEQEANLLRLLVNKLGDSDKKIASKTSYNILQLETAHPLMKPTIISAIENDLLFRHGQSLHAQYYAIITLNQTILSGKEEDVAKTLLGTYFSLFAKLLAKPKPKNSEVDAIRINQKGEIQGGGGPAGKAARRKAALNEKATAVEDDLREKMLSAVLTGVNRAVPYTNTKDGSFEQHLDTLFRITHSSNFNTSIQALMLIQQLNDTNQIFVDRYYRALYESLLDPRLLTSSKQALYLNLLFKSLRSDLNIKRVKAFTKRLLQVVSMHQPSFACGALYMLRELEGTFAGFSAFIDDPEENGSDEEEVFHDVQDDETAQPIPQAEPKHPTTQKRKIPTYDSRKRDPEHSNAEKSCLWELLPFLTHYHPSVSLFATRLLTHAPMPPKPDLSSHTLIHFLDRFVYRNPKTNVPARGASIMQPLSSSATDKSILFSATSLKDRIEQPVNSEAFWKMETDKVGADEVFFHKYFSALGKGREKVREKKERTKRTGEKEGSEEDEDEIWKALVESKPEIEGESDEDDSMDDLEDLDEEMASEGEDMDIDGEETEGGVKEAGRAVEPDDDAVPDFGDEDDEGMLGSEDEVPSDLEAMFEKEVQATDESMLQDRTSKKRRDGKKEKRRKLKHLPTFASADDYAKMLGDEEDDV
ncbi:MAG: hypothetical protein Q9181_000980 [Wetmoreana brouardii]